jgi:hypothetical protein
MESLLRDRSVKECVELMKILVSHIQTAVPDDTMCKDVLTLIDNVVLTNSGRCETAVKDWVCNMQTPLHKKIKYGRAVERLTGSPASVYHACAYRDVDALEQSSKSQLLMDVDFFKKIRTKTELGASSWPLIDAISKRCYEVESMQIPSVPTHQEIEANITATKKQLSLQSTTSSPSGTAPDTSCLVVAFEQDFAKLCTFSWTLQS